MQYVNFNLISPFLLNLQNLEDDEEFQQALKTSHGQRPGVVSDISCCVSIGMKWNFDSYSQTAGHLIQKVKILK